MDVTLNFTWYKDTKGYRFVPTTTKRRPGQSILDAKLADIQPARIVRLGGTLLSYRPFEKVSRLHNQFISLAKTESGVLRFVETFGPLTHEGLRGKGDAVHDVITHAEDMTKVLRGGIVALPLGPLQTTIQSDRRGVMRLEVRPRSLIDALWFELSQDKSKTDFRECLECSKLFQVGGGARRVGAIFCSDECRVKHNNKHRGSR